MLSFHTHGVALTQSLRQFIRTKLELALERLSGSVKKVEVHLTDQNGPNRGGEDKSCRIVVQLFKQKSLVLHDQDADLGVLLNRITDRLSRVADRRLERQRNHRSEPYRWPTNDLTVL